MPTTKRDLQALHYLAKRLRDETPGAGEWHDAGITTELAKLEGHNLAITVERVTRHAGDPEARTPAAIGRPFIPAAPVPGVRHPVKAGEDCRRHVGEDADACRLCPVERISHPEDPADGDGSAGVTLLAEIRKRREMTTTNPEESA